MADLPSYVIVTLDGYSEDFDPAVERTEMERGYPQERIINSLVLMKLKLRFLFVSRQDTLQFDDWYFDTIGRIGFFNMRHPRKGTMINVRFEGGKIGELQPISAGFGVAARDCTVEYLR